MGEMGEKKDDRCESCDAGCDSWNDEFWIRNQLREELFGIGFVLFESDFAYDVAAEEGADWVAFGLLQ